MRKLTRPVAIALAVVSSCLLSIATGNAVAQEAKTEVLVPGGDRGAIVVVLSSSSGPAVHQPFARALAAAGYYVVLADGRDFLVALGAGDLRGMHGAVELDRVIAAAQTAPQAIPGKVAVVGFALGGAAALKHAAPLDRSVAAIVAFYPNLKPLGSDLAGLAEQIRVPVLVLAGEKDLTCCHAGTVQELAAAAKQAPFELKSYTASGHAFDIPTSPGHVAADADDATGRAMQFLKRWHPLEGR